MAFLRVVCVLLFVLSAVLASDDLSKTLDIQAHFPATANVITEGESTSLIFTVTNNGEHKATIHHLSGSLYNPKNPKQIIKNITASRVRVAIAPSKVHNITYKFKVEMEPREIGLIVNMDWYNEEEHDIRTVAFNNLIKIKATDSLFDLQSLSLYLLIIAAIGGAGYYAYNTYIVAPATKKTKTKKAKAAPVVKDADEIAKENDDWIPEHVKKAQKAAEEATRSPKLKKRN